MKTYTRAIPAVGFALLVLSSAAFAGAGIINTTVTKLGDVTYSLPASGKNSASTNYLGARVSVSSDSANTNTINNIRFTATAVVEGASGKATFSSALGATCDTTVNPGTTTNDETSIECYIGQLRAGEPFPEFVVFFKAPEKATTDLDNTEIKLNWITWYAEGTGGVPNSTPPNSFKDGTATFGLGVSDTKKLRTAVKSGGGKFFTGYFGVPNKVDDFFATTLNVPAVGSNEYSTATIDETAPMTGLTDPTEKKCPPGYTDCKDIAEINVKDQTGATRLFSSTSPLIIILRRDKSQFTGNFSNQPVWWFDNTSYVQIDPCSNDADPLQKVERCVKKCEVLRNGDPEVKINPDLSGDGQCTILTKKNGFYAW